MYEYEICNQADQKIFYKQCEAIEKKIPSIKKGDYLVDVDDSQIQIYEYEGSRIKVINSRYTDEVYIESEIPLAPFFKS